MKKVLLYLIAALLVVGIPLGALAGTQVFKATDKDVDYWEFCPFFGPSTDFWPGGPAQEFGIDVYIHYVGTEKFNVPRQDGDVGWNRNVHGTASSMMPARSRGGGDVMAMMRALPKMNVTTSTGS